jgi:hypothetical protein
VEDCTLDGQDRPVHAAAPPDRLHWSVLSFRNHAMAALSATSCLYDHAEQLKELAGDNQLL